MPSGAVIVVSGMIAGTPGQGGATWAVLQYVLGLRALGCAVTFVEPIDQGDHTEQVRYCAEVMSGAGLDGQWSLIGSDGATIAGLDEHALDRTARAADVLINVSGMLTHQRIIERVATRVYLDLDPAFIQMWQAYDGVDMRFDAHTHFVSLSDSIGA